MEKERSFYERLKEKGVSRRDFMKYCTASRQPWGCRRPSFPRWPRCLPLPPASAGGLAAFWECTGCSESLLRSSIPIDELVLEILSVEYHETIMAAAGHQAEEQLHNAVKKYEGKFICVVEGGVATKYNGGYGKVGGRSFLKSPRKFAQGAAVIAYRHLCDFRRHSGRRPQPGWIQGCRAMPSASNPQPSRMSAQPDQSGGHRGQLSAAGQTARPGRYGPALFAYGKTIHDKCPRRSHFENEEFVEEFGSEEAAMGYCLYKVGCRGPETYNNCPTPSSTTAPAGRWKRAIPASAAASPTFWDTMTPFYEEM
jgi:[NiFe] hydrogenase small subunit